MPGVSMTSRSAFARIQRSWRVTPALFSVFAAVRFAKPLISDDFPVFGNADDDRARWSAAGDQAVEFGAGAIDAGLNAAVDGDCGAVLRGIPRQPSARCERIGEIVPAQNHQARPRADDPVEFRIRTHQRQPGIEHLDHEVDQRQPLFEQAHRPDHVAGKPLYLRWWFGHECRPWGGQRPTRALPMTALSSTGPHVRESSLSARLSPST